MNQELRAEKDDLIGRVLLGRYRVVRELAKGGMGVVYLARAEGAVGFVKPVVVKLVLPEHAQDERFVAMFVREAQILAQLRHPSVVDVLEFGEEDGAYVLVLEYVRGYHLGQWTRYLRLKNRLPPVDILIQIVIDVLEALHHAHNQVHPDGTPMQIVHRDVSPGNILLDEDGRGRLLDFGVARMRGSGAEYKTQVKGFMGKLPYIPPEVFAGADASPRSDLYACGVVLHEVLIGRNVFRAESQAATLHKVMTHVPEPVEQARPGVPQGLDAVLARALAKQPEERFPDARAFASALRKLQRDQESEIRARLADLLKADFGREMAELLRIESLADRDEAWRKLSQPPARAQAQGGDELSPADAKSGVESKRDSGISPRAVLPEPPPALGATVANLPSARARTSQLSLSVARAQSAPARDESVAAAQPPAEAPVEPAAPVPPATAPRAASRGVLVAMGAVGALALIAIGLALRPQPPAPVPIAQPIRIVSEPLDPAAQPALAAAEPTQAQTSPAPAPAEVEPEAKPDSKTAHASGAGKPAKAKGPDPRDLTRAFRKQQPKLEACYKQHAAAGAVQPSTQIEFDLDARGKLTHVAITPRSLASTPLGECLLRIARSTSFPAQGQLVSFAIPVTASRTAAD